MTALAGRYRLGGVIGAGSFATVHRARDERLDADVAVKVLAENHSLSPEIRERFIAEGRSLRRVGGRHLVSVHDIGQNERQQPYLVLELADRGSLRARVESLRAAGWRASREDVLAVARPLAAAVAAVHEAQLVHRDLSPGNLLLAGTSGEAARAVGIEASTSAVVRDDERLLVADLGMCKDLARSSGLTVAAGTDGFRPPEQSRPGTVDIRADIWAMSALVDWLVQDAETSPELEEVLARGLSEDPDARQAEATAWLAELEEALAPPPPATPTDDPAPGTVPHGLVADDTAGVTDGGAAPALADGEIDEPPAQPFEITQHVLDRSITVYDPARSITELGGGEPAEDEMIVLEADILFSSNAWDLPSGAADRIVELAADIPEGATVQVDGHTDALPVDRTRYDFDNQQLSENRAQAVADALAEERPDLTFEVTGHGDTKPVASGGSEDSASLAKNRRVELRYGD